MAYNLNLDIGGLCLFVSQPSTSAGVPDRMHVLMPANVGADSGHVGHRHIPLLVFDATYLTGFNIPPKTMMVHILLRELTVEIPGPGASLFRCPDIVDLTPVVGKPLRKGVLALDPLNLTTSRVTMAAGRMNGLYPGVCWGWDPGQTRRMAHRVRWTAMFDDTGPFKLKLNELRTGNPNREISLTAQPGTPLDSIDLTIVHCPPDDLPVEIAPVGPAPEYDAPAPHFDAYFSLFDAGANVRVPLFRSVEGCMAFEGTGCEKLQDEGGSPYTCMVAGFNG